MGRRFFRDTSQKTCRFVDRLYLSGDKDMVKGVFIRLQVSFEVVRCFSFRHFLIPDCAIDVRKTDLGFEIFYL